MPQTSSSKAAGNDITATIWNQIITDIGVLFSAIVEAIPTLKAGTQESGDAACSGYVNAVGGQAYAYIPFKTKMTNTPSSVTLSGISYANCTSLVFINATKDYFRVGITATNTNVPFSCTFSYVTVGN